MATAKKELIEIRPIQIEKVKVRIVGDTPLIMHAWSAKSKREILEKELKVTKTKAKELRNPLEDFVSSMYWLTPMPEQFDEETVTSALNSGAKFGFPVTGFKQAAISAAYRMGWAKDKMSLRGAFFIEADYDTHYTSDLFVDWSTKKITVLPNARRDEPMIEIHSDLPEMREDMIRVGNGGADIRYRGEFKNWYADLTINYNANGQQTLENIINIINAGGYVCGVGEWRPEKDGQYGMFHVDIS